MQRSFTALAKQRIPLWDAPLPSGNFCPLGKTWFRASKSKWIEIPTLQCFGWFKLKFVLICLVMFVFSLVDSCLLFHAT